MNKGVTVDEAISKGHRMVNYPVFIIIIGVIGLTIYLVLQKIIPTWCFPVGFILAFGFAWLMWSIMITKWRLWAFDNVRNVHELKKRAIQEKLIWADNSILKRRKFEVLKTKKI